MSAPKPPAGPSPPRIAIYDRPPWWRRRSARALALAALASVASLAALAFWLG